jgi:hypothetical protein
MQYSEISPICLFAYNRLKETTRTIEALQQNYLAPQSELFIFSENASEVKGDVELTAEVRNYLRQITGFKKITLRESTTHQGLANSIISGVSEVIGQYGKVIVVEDDLITAPNFLNFMNEGLSFYENEDRVFSISGYTFDLPSLRNFPKDYYLGYRASSWGWASWLDRWAKIDWEVKDYSRFRRNWLQQLKFMRGGINMPFMLHNQMHDRVDSWAIRWCYHQFKFNLLTVFPSKSKVVNIGFGAAATNTKENRESYSALMDNGVKKDFVFDKKLIIYPKQSIEFWIKCSSLNNIIGRIFK